MRGLAITAGSSLIVAAMSGRVEPIDLAKMTTSTSVTQIMSAMFIGSLSISMSLMKFADESVTPQMTATVISYQSTLKKSLNLTS